jgi:hypothetical protein
LRESRKVVRDSAGTHAEPHDHVPPPPRDLSRMTAEAEQTARSGFGKRAFGAFSAAKERMRPHPNGVHEPSDADAVRTWPASSEPEVPADEIEQQLEWTSGTWAFTPPSDSQPPSEPMSEEPDWTGDEPAPEAEPTEHADPDDPARA